jgi:hypothetical protein
MSLHLPVFAGLLSAYLINVLQLRHVLEHGQELAVEWLAWAILILFAWVRQKSAKKNFATAHETRTAGSLSALSVPSDGFKSISTTAGLLFLSQLLWARSFGYIWWSTVRNRLSFQLWTTHADVNMLLKPLVNIAIFIFSRHRAAPNSSLWDEAFTSMARTRAQRARNVLAPSPLPSWTFYGLMISSSVFMISFSAVGAEKSLLPGLLYLILQTFVLIALRDGDSAAKDPWSPRPSMPRLYLLSGLLWSFYNLYAGTPTRFELWTAALGLLRSVQLHSILKLV